MRQQLRNVARAIYGTVLERLRPDLVRKLDADIAGAESEGDVRAKAAILYARLRRARLVGNRTAAEAALRGWWQAETGDDFYDSYRDRFGKWFFGPHQVLIDRLCQHVADAGLTELVEIGCGDGRALAHCATRMPDLERLVGLDVNAGIIARNRAATRGDARITFEVGDAGAWLTAHPSGGRVLLSYGGVMEYLAPETLAALLRGLAAHPPAAVALCEPVAPEHDLDRETGALMFGFESSFSHNHAHQLRAAGFHVLWQQEMLLDGIRWMMIMAETEGPDAIISAKT
jgi:SAM-dependent methyltransferase